MTEKIVGRAELKLAEAVEAFRFDLRGETVLDIGSSTGGFTELARRCGAKKVIAIEKGTREISAPLRCDPRVELHEKVGFLALEDELLEVEKVQQYAGLLIEPQLELTLTSVMPNATSSTLMLALRKSLSALKDPRRSEKSGLHHLDCE